MSETLQNLVIIGAGGLGREVVDIVDALNAEDPEYRLLGFIDDGSPDSQLLGALELSHLGGRETLRNLPSGTGFSVAISNAVVRREVATIAERWGLRPVTLVHPSASIGRSSTIGPGAVLAAGVRVTTNVVVGAQVHLNLNVTVGHDSTLMDHVSVNPLAAVSGNVTIERDVLIGTGATINQGLRIGEGAVVGAGAAVIGDVAAGVVVGGVPARPLRTQ